MRAAVEGIQSNALIANPNTYLLNNVEDTRWWGSQEADERTIMELYLPPFEGAVAAGAGSTMCSYNKVVLRNVGERSMTETLLFVFRGGGARGQCKKPSPHRAVVLILSFSSNCGRRPIRGRCCVLALPRG